MKIGILTYHRTINYGTFLQCYSLVKKLQKEYANIDIEVIDYSTPHNYYFPYLMGARLLTLGVYSQAIKHFSRISCFRKFQKLLPLSRKVITRKTGKFLEKIKYKYDVIIVGSDTIFNCAFGFPNPFFLNADLGCYKLSYAASSYGIRPDDNKNRYIKEALSKFEFIGLRDRETENFLQKICPNKQMYHTCEPTLFLDISNLNVDMNKLKFLISKKANSNKPLIGIMSTNRELAYIVKKHFSETHIIISVAMNNPYADINLLDLSPFEWANVFSLFDITFTNFFHGTVFSIKNYTPVIAVNRLENDSEEVGKVEDFLIRMNLQDWYFKDIRTQKKQVEMVLKAKEIISNCDKNKIKEALHKEMEYFSVFKKSLDNLIKKSVKK